MAFAQSAFHVGLGPVVRVDHLNFGPSDAPYSASGDVTVAGVHVTVTIARHFGADAEFTKAWGQVEGEASPYYHDMSISPGFGWSSALVAGGAVSPRVGLFGRVGIAARSYSETVSPMLYGTVPIGPPGFVEERWLSGLLLGLDVPVAWTNRLSVTPEFRVVQGLILSDYQELGVGVRAAWRFR